MKTVAAAEKVVSEAFGNKVRLGSWERLGGRRVLGVCTWFLNHGSAEKHGTKRKKGNTEIWKEVYPCQTT